MPVPASSAVVVESGPVMYDDVAVEDEDEDEEEEPCMSAVDLLGSHGQCEHSHGRTLPG